MLGDESKHELRGRYPRIRTDVFDAIDLYVEKGCEPGGFVLAVLRNDLMDAMGRADVFNRMTLFDICGYVYNEIPAPCHGSPEKVREWIAARAKEQDDRNRTTG